MYDGVHDAFLLICKHIFNIGFFRLLFIDKILSILIQLLMQSMQREDKICRFTLNNLLANNSTCKIHVEMKGMKYIHNVIDE